MLNGIDVSHWQNATASKSTNYDFLIAKATEGTGFVDNQCNTHLANAKAKGAQRGVYHFANANLNPGQAGAVKEANHFLKSIAGYIGDVALILDWEAASVKVGPQWAKYWLDHIYQQTGIRPWFYTYQAAITSSYKILTDYPLWLARYGANAPGGYRPNTPVPNIAPWQVITAFQYCSQGRLSGYNANLDLDVFYGTKETWAKLSQNPGTTPAPPTPPATVNLAAKLPVLDLRNAQVTPVKGKDVTTLQGLLLANWQGGAALLGDNEFPDGIGAAGTKAALIAFQTENGLTPDAVCGASTWAKLLNQ